MRGERFCELIAIFDRQSGFEVDLYNTWTLNECPEDAWRELELAEFRADQSPLLVALRGPNFWAADQSVDLGSGYDGLRFIDSIEFGYRSKHLLLPPVSDTLVYLNFFFYEFGLEIETELVFFTGSTVYELISPVGKRYVMRSWSHSADETHTPENLQEGLLPPPGWEFRERELEEDLRLADFQSVVTALWDNFYNTWYRAEDLEVFPEDRVAVELFNTAEQEYWLGFMSAAEAETLDVTGPWEMRFFQPVADKHFITRSPDQREHGRFRQAELFGHTFTYSYDGALLWRIPDPSALFSTSQVYASNELTYAAGSQVAVISNTRGESYILFRRALNSPFSTPELPEGWGFSRRTLSEDLRVQDGISWIHIGDDEQVYQGPVTLPSS